MEPSHDRTKWLGVALALVVWWGAEWWLYRGSSGQTSLADFRNYVGNAMLVHDERTEESWDGPPWMT